MNKLKMQTPNITEQNIEQIAKLFPHVMTETQDENGKTKKAIDFDLLKQSLSAVLVEDADERYRLDWPGKKAALLKANTPITKTLRPCREDSVNFDSTENVYIEGDNFEVLKILQESYLGKIKMIYIDPPYNTGKDFIYKDNFTAKKADYEEELGTTDEDDNKLFKNTDTNGRFHSDWLSMMYERLLVARDLLKEDGVIFISIDDNEVHNLRKICDDIFGGENFVTNLIWEKKYTRANDARYFSDNHDHILCYGKSKEKLKINQLPRNESQLSAYKNPDNHLKGKWKATPLHAKSGTNTSPYIFENGNVWTPPLGTYRRFNDESMEKMDRNNEIWFGLDGKQVPQRKSFLCEIKDGVTPITLWKYEEVGHNHEANNDIKNLKLGGVFSNPKPVRLILQALRLTTKATESDMILDFFSGSATTSHSIFQLNSEDKGNRKFIMVQLPQETGIEEFPTICELGKERIRRAGKKIIEDNQDKEGIDKLDIGFRVYKTDSTNMKAVYYHPEQLRQDDLFALENNIKEDRTPDDLLTQVILDLGLELNLPIEQKDMHGNNVFIVQTNALVACFDNNINIKIIDEIAELKPFKVVFKDASFTASKDRINLEERFKRLSPETLITVI